ncbi:hemagglutination domain protein [Campylobacter lari]|uniref:two-partner secretion domain-containing protein n=1 Tax=Campylobacter lari TaxID=201 RepID=UPI000F705F14|nr:filamentous hemagglutinin N-terminal domain-containing protein [Campylobacter lari]VEJ05983.1 hemagglutination domain protein [Campylobacter lari]
MKKLANHIILSGVTVSMLFSPLMALPSGGKFTHGTSGSISINGKEMNIAGNKQNSIIQWGGGFNIANGEKVNFGNSKFEGQQNYLNIAHGTDKSTIEGVLNAGGNNVFLINPNGVIITKTGTINANRFVASTTSLQAQHFEEFKAQGASFSPIFKSHKAGNVVNMGNISAKNVTLQGNKVMLSADTSWDKKNNKIKLNQITADSIDLKGNEVYVDISTINSKNLTTDAKKGIAYLSATGYYYNPTRKYNDIIFATKGVMDKTYNQYISIGSDLDWWHFAKGWNEKDDFRNNVVGDTFKLTNDIDFKASSGQNYANYCIDGLGCTNMIVGFGGDIKDGEVIYNNAFTADFDGQGYTLKNIFIDTTKIPNSQNSGVGIFGATNGANFKNINIDYMGGGIKAANLNVGGFAGYFDGVAENISLKNIGSIKNTYDSKKIVIIPYISFQGVGGFAGSANGLFRNITLENIKNFDVNYISILFGSSGSYQHYGVGGFAGASFGMFDNISLKNMGNFKIDFEKKTSGSIKYAVGGFAGFIANGSYNNIKLEQISNLWSHIDEKGKDHLEYVLSLGGFAGNIQNGNFENIVLNNVKKIHLNTNQPNSYYETNLGGFAGEIDNGVFNKISLYDIGDIKVDIDDVKYHSKYNLGGFAGKIITGNFDNISLNKIKDIAVYIDSEDASFSGSDYEYNLGGFAGKIGGETLGILGVPTFNNISLNEVENITTNSIKKDTNETYGVGIYTNLGGFAGKIQTGKFENIVLKDVKNIKADIASRNGGVINIGGFVGELAIAQKGTSFKNIFLNNIENIHVEIGDPVFNRGGIINMGGFAGVSDSQYAYHNVDFENIVLQGISSLKNIINTGCQEEWCASPSVTTGGFIGKFGARGRGTFKNIYMFFDPEFDLIVENKLGDANIKLGKFYGEGYLNPSSSNIHIYHHKDTLKNANNDSSDYGNDKINIHTYNDSTQESFYQQFKNQEEALMRPIVVLPDEFYPYNPSKPSEDINIPNIETIKNEQATLDKEDILDDSTLNTILNDLKDKFYIVNINILDELLKAYSKIDKNNPTSKAEFLANYLLSKDKYPDDKERLDIAHSMIQSLDFLLAYQDNGLSEASDDKFANKDTKDTNIEVTSKVVEVYNQTNANKDQVNHFIQTTLNNKVNSINEANKNFSEKNYYEEINTLALAYNKYVELINKGLANKNDQAFKDISNKLFALIAQAQGETKTIEELINSFEDLKTQASEKSNGHFIVEGDLQALNIPYPILASIKDNNNGSGEIDKPEKPIDPIEPPIDNKPDFSLSFEQSSTFNSIGNDSLDDEEEQEEIEEASMNQKGKTCIVSDNYRTMNPCVVGGL